MRTLRLSRGAAPRSAEDVSLRPGTTTLRSGRASMPHRTVLRYGVRPFLVFADLLAWILAVQVTGGANGEHLVLLAVTMCLYGAAGLYRSRLSLSALDDSAGLAGRALAASAITTSLALLIDERLVDPALLGTAAIFACSAVLARALAYAAVRRTRALGWVAHPTLVLGAGRIGGHLAQLLLEHPSYGLRPVGFLDSDPLLEPDERPVPVLGDNDALASVIVEFGVRDVIVAFGSAPGSHMVDIIRTCDRLHAEIFFVPRLFELHNTSRDMDQVWGLPLVRLRRAAFRTFSWRLKRGLDVCVSAVALLLLSPLLGVIAAAVRAEGGPGILFRQQRVGLDGRAFDLLKFRSLKPVDEAESATLWNVAADDRLGPVGRFLRRSSLDELPQLWNILRGDMTLVGPRPERPHFVATFARTYPRYTARHRVPAGLTGWAQVHGLRGDTSIEERARFDNFYIENWSLWSDVKIMLRTLSSVLRRSGG
ncbi:MAG: exopolysaccharide biosynthesis polyprenyl glycosylphosphotransferase [Frankiales bacterium]|nr:exopolysaccharide biosynthesis polyprenyl glycosylphosphotransferase [Frankiales bacterium]